MKDIPCGIYDMPVKTDNIPRGMSPFHKERRVFQREYDSFLRNKQYITGNGSYSRWNAIYFSKNGIIPEGMENIPIRINQIPQE